MTYDPSLAATRRARREYDRRAASYDRWWASYVRRTTAATLARLPVALSSLSGAALDVGCGTGVLLRELTRAAAGLRLCGLDLSPGMLGIARRRLGTGVPLVAATADRLPFAPGAFDLVVSCSSLHFWPDPSAALAEAGRVLRPGGRLVLTDWCDDYLLCRLFDRLLRLWDPAHRRAYGSGECRRLLQAAGFEALSVERYKIGWLWGMMTAVAIRSPPPGQPPVDGKPNPGDRT